MILYYRIYNIKAHNRNFVGSIDCYKFYVSISNDALFYGMSLNRMIELREQNMDADMISLRVSFLKAILDSTNLKESTE